ncbi:hypothetical protein [Legionella norrlandica]|uniref:hypothetical protein n=1 Tax=Legionella norrlandica TaxID=1498499 RepID=UPI001F4CB895|nr:hypothetical protein [Legionella norrlandica]
MEKNLKATLKAEKPQASHATFHRIKEEFQKFKAGIVGKNREPDKQKIIENDSNASSRIRRP